MFHNEGLAQYAQWRGEIEQAWELMNASINGRRGCVPDEGMTRGIILPEDDAYYRASLKD